ncbi:hypothetical protein FRC08_005043 [Ceratobasidium sp. 394]|nr:hypothetical protein FRC08_005043 [Ceratobasidium sp. 394]
MSDFTEEWMFAHDGLRLYTRRYIPSSATGGAGTWGASGAKAAILFVHGFIEHVGRYEHVFPRYAEKGIVVFTYDGRGFGRSALDTKNRRVYFVSRALQI